MEYEFKNIAIDIVDKHCQLCRLGYSKPELALAFKFMLEQVFLPERKLTQAVCLECLLLTEDEISILNQQYMGCIGPTNILSFPLLTNIGPLRPLGTLVVSANTLHREANLYQQKVQPYSLKMLAHGLGHLFGYEHGKAMDRIADSALNSALYNLEKTGWTKNV